MSATARDALSISVNGEARVVSGPCTVDVLLARLALEGRRVAVAINHDVVPRSEFTSHRLEPGDRVEILEAVGGGA
jgi:sulfur carrier protein